MSDTERRAHQVFLEALEQPPDQRTAWLTAACGGDAKVLRQVQELLAVEQNVGSFLEEPFVAGPGLNPAVHSLVDRRIGRYQVLRLLGVGGMSVVYEARQEQPARLVALKFLRGGGSPRLEQRFTSESEILARLRHPHVAQIYEAGVHEEEGLRLPYFAMEHVPEARTLTAYAQEESLPLERRLELFASVCDAVHHGHQKGVIHRDLKPANILVDSAGDPKVIDFGIARTLQDDLPGQFTRTGAGQLVGTLQYMSPEQCAGDPRDLDTRVDVYALGVILFELLADRRPYEVSSERIMEAVQIIRERPAPALGGVDRRLRGDLETIAAKALSKDREQRYASALALGEDVRRFLRDEPILARPPGALYQIGKFSRRNKLLVAGLAGGVLALIVGLISSTIAWSRESEQRQNAQRAQAATAYEAETVRQMNEFLVSMLEAPNPWSRASPERPAREMRMRDVLDRAAERLDRDFASRPIEEARLRMVLATTYRSLGELGDARRQVNGAARALERSAGDDPMAAADQLLTLHLRHEDGLLCMHEGNFAAAERAMDELLATPTLAELPSLASQAYHTHAYSLRELGNYDEAAEAAQACLAVVPADAEHRTQRLSAQALLAGIECDRGDVDRAEQLYQEVLADYLENEGIDHPDALGTANELADLYMDTGRTALAIAELEATVERQRRVLPEDHPALLNTLNSLGVALDGSGQSQRAIEVLEDAYQRRAEVLGADHPDALGSQHNLGCCLLNLGRLEPAREVLTEVELGFAETLGGEHPKTMTARNNLATVLVHIGDLEGARELYEITLDSQLMVLGEEHPDTLFTRARLLHLLIKEQQWDMAMREAEDNLAACRENLGEDHQHTWGVLSDLGWIFVNLGEFDRARELLTEALERQRAGLGDVDQTTLVTFNRLAVALIRLEEIDAAVKVIVQKYEVTRDQLGPGDPRTTAAHAQLVDFLDRYERVEEAARWREDFTQATLATPPTR